MNSNAVAKKTTDFPSLLKQFSGEIARALPKHLNGDRMSRIALTAFRRSPLLAKCEPKSIFAAVIQASQLGLEPDMLGRSYLVPYRNKTGEYECQFIPGWKGLVDLVNRAGNATVWTGAVFEGDEFDYQQGDTPFVRHKPTGEDDPNRLTHVYAVGRVKGAEWPNIEVWTIRRVLKHRDRYNKVGKSHYSYGNIEMYARKVVLLQVLKYMPASADLSVAIALNDTGEMGRQHLSVDDAINGTWTPVEPDEDEVNQQRAPDINERIARSASPTPADTGIHETQAETVDHETGEITDPFAELRADPEYADWCAAVESKQTIGELASLMNEMPPKTKAAMRAFLESQQDRIKGKAAA